MYTYFFRSFASTKYFFAHNDTKKKAFSGNLKITSPIELQWDDLDRKIRTSCPKSAGDLWEKLREAWGSLEQETLDKIVKRMPPLGRAVIKSKGGFIYEKI